MTTRLFVALAPLVIAALVVMGGSAGCSRSSNKTTGSLPTGHPGHDELSPFVIDLVTNQTRETNRPVEIDDRTLADEENPASYEALFR